MKRILTIRNLTIHYYTLEGIVEAVRNVSFTIDEGESLCLIGESGSGKSTVGLAVLGALPENARIVSGEILLGDVDILKLKHEELEKIRGREVSIIFQDPAASFNPLFTIGEVLEDILRHKLGLRDKGEIRRRALELLKTVGLPDPERIYKSYPHELSGGMLQRAAIAVALSTNPKLLVADEPTTMLDVTLQAQILELLQELRRKLKLTLLFITHNLGVAAMVSDKILVIYAGAPVELGPTEEILTSPLHPYTRKLLECVPRANVKIERLNYIPGSLPDLRRLPRGCVFEPRCELAIPKCKTAQPSMKEVKSNHLVACYRYEGG